MRGEGVSTRLHNRTFSRKCCTKTEYQLKETRQHDNRKPTALPNEEDLERLRTSLNEDVSSKSSLPIEQVTRPGYIRLRKVVLTRLTLLNARRGSEPTWIVLTDFSERHEQAGDKLPRPL